MYLKFRKFWKKNEHFSWSILEIIDSKESGYLKV